ncbi:MAG TPA: winged helix-turn-helix domain-containing protein [Burkholderiaceae bacterium]|nr:winged helix-turn-helix domain-containing protein [Burkholderiaceae bacterium]
MEPAQESGRLRFCDWEMVPAQRKLIVRGTQAPIGSRAFDVLLALAAQPGRVMNRSQLLDAAWPGLVVEENNLSVQITTLRKHLGASAITTIPGVGYCLTAAPLPGDASGPLHLPRPVAVQEGPGTEPGAAPDPAARQHRLGNVPVHLPALVDREAEERDLVQLVRNTRVVSVIGAGGIGKTSLAQAAASALRHEFEHGVWIIELAPLADSELVPAAVVSALGIVLPGQRPPQLEVVEALAGLSALLVLDNCEHVVGTASSFAHALFSRTDGVHVLATSQVALKLSEERVFRVGPLSLPEGDEVEAARASGAVSLLVQRVQAQQPAFALESGNLADAIEICRRLDGLPLAIELAAARVPHLGLSGVRHLLNERFRVLSGGTRVALPRHRTLLAALDWSHGLLSGEEQRVFRRAGAFAGSFGLAQALRVLAGGTLDEWAVLEALGALIDRSLVVMDQMDPPRYRLLESSRAFALDNLRQAREADEILHHHAEAMLDLLEQSIARRWELASQDLLRAYLPDLDNVRAALEWSAVGASQIYIGLAGASAWLFAAAGLPVEGLQHCSMALQRLDASTSPLLEARLQQGWCTLSHYAEGGAKLMAARRAVELYRAVEDRKSLYSALGRLAITAAVSGDCVTGRRMTAEMQAVADPAWPPLARWDLLNAQDYVANQEAHHEEAHALALQQLELATTAGDTGKRLFALMALEQCAAARGDWAEAVERGRHLVSCARQERYVEKMNVYVANLATALIMTDQLDEGLLVAREAAAADRRAGTLWQSLDQFAMLAFKRGRLRDAALVLGCSEERNRWRNAAREPVEQQVRNQLMSALERSAIAAELSALLDQGARLDDDVAATIALAS